MKKETSNPLKKLAVLLLIPATGFFLWASAEPEYHVTTGEALQQTSNVYLPENDSVPVETPKVHNKVVKKAPAVLQKDTLKSEVHQDSSPLYSIDEVESAAALNKISPEQIESVSVIKDEAATAIDIQNGKYYIQNGKYTTCDDHEHPHFYFISPKANYGEKGKNGVALITTKNINKSSPLILIDGKESSGSIEELDPRRIESISVLKNEAATSIYGEKGKNGVVLITTKKLY